MTQTAITRAIPDLEIIEGQITTTSQQIAAHFNKVHRDVVRAIENIECSAEFRLRNFAQSSFEAEMPNGGKRKHKSYRLTRDGFVFLAMGFTGKDAAQWKEAYITAFNKMEAELLARTTRPHNPAIDYDRISPAQAQDLKEIVAAIVQEGIQGYGETWSRLQRKFRVNSYLELPATQHLEARAYLLAKLPKPDPASVVEEAQPTINPLNAQAMAAASKQANEYFDAARQGKYLQQPTAFPPEVLCGLLAQAMLNQRFMLSFDRCTGRMNFKPVPDDAYVLSWQQFARAVVTNDIDPSNAELADLASACSRRLAQRLAA